MSGRARALKRDLALGSTSARNLLDAPADVSDPDVRGLRVMRKADLVRAIFVKLRQEAPAEFSDGDVLRFANFFVETRTKDPDLLREFGRAVDGHSLALAPVDEAMSDGGWRILEYEGRLRRGRDGHDVAYQRTLTTLIERYLGPEWRQHQWNGPR